MKQTMTRKPIARVPRTTMANRMPSKKMLIKAKAKKIAKAFEEEAECILEDTEEAVKQNFPAKHVRASLAKIAAALAKEGIKCRFDAKLQRTASDDEEFVVTVDELQEAVDAIVDATVDEFEALLEETDEATDEIVDDVAEHVDDIDIADIEDELKTNVETELACVGVKSKLTRKHVAKKKTASTRKSKRVNPILARMR